MRKSWDGGVESGHELLGGEFLLLQAEMD